MQPGHMASFQPRGKGNTSLCPFPRFSVPDLSPPCWDRSLGQRGGDNGSWSIHSLEDAGSRHVWTHRSQMQEINMKGNGEGRKQARRGGVGGMSYALGMLLQPLGCLLHKWGQVHGKRWEKIAGFPSPSRRWVPIVSLSMCVWAVGMQAPFPCMRYGEKGPQAALVIAVSRLVVCQ